MGLYTWRLKLSLSAARDILPARAAPSTDHESAIRRWREAMMRERAQRWGFYPEPMLVPVRVPINRGRR